MSETRVESLTKFSTPDLTIPEFKPAFQDVSDEFYETLYREIETLGKIVINHLSVTYSQYGYHIDYDETTAADYEAAIKESPKIVIQGLVSKMHMTERIIREHLHIDNLYQAATKDVDVETNNRIQAFISDGCIEHLSGKEPVEGILLRYFRTQERNRHQHARGAFYQTIHATLQTHGYAVHRDDTLSGCPNIVVNKSKPIQITDPSVIGKALRAKPNDIPKRARHAGACCEKFAREAPNASHIIVFKISNQDSTGKNREQTRQEILQQNPSTIDGVFFDDETDLLIKHVNKALNSQNSDC